MNLQVIASPHGDILWVPGTLPGSVHDKRPSGSGESSTNWRSRAWSRSPIRATRAASGRRCHTRGRTSPSHRKRPTGPTRNSAPRTNGQTPSSRPGTSLTSSAAAPGKQAASPRQSTHCNSATPNEVGNGSVCWFIYHHISDSVKPAQRANAAASRSTSPYTRQT